MDIGRLSQSDLHDRVTEQKKGVCDRLTVSPTCRYVIILGAPRNGGVIGVYFNPNKILETEYYI